MDWQNPVLWLAYALLILSVSYVWWGIQRRRRLSELQKEGYTITKTVDAKDIKKLKALAPDYLGKQNLGLGVYPIGGAILYWWLAQKQIRDKNIYCWAFRKAEGRGRNVNEKWWICIAIEGCDPTAATKIVRAARSAAIPPVSTLEYKNKIVFLFKRPLFFFNNNIVNTLKRLESVVK